MKIAFISTIAPNVAATEGGGITCYEFIRGLKSLGHEIIFLNLRPELQTDLLKEEDKQAQDCLSNLAVQKVININCPREYPATWTQGLPQPFRSLAGRVTQHRLVKSIFKKVTGQVAECIQSESPDLCFAFSEAIPYTPAIKGIPLACWAIHSGEPYRQIALDFGLWRVLRSKKLAQLVYPMWRYLNHRKTIKIMSIAESIIMHSYFWGKQQAPYFANKQNFWAVPHPGADVSDEIPRTDPFLGGNKDVYDIILIGRKQTSFGRANIEYLIHEIAPEIQKRNLGHKFQFSLVGPQEVAPQQVEEMNRYSFIKDEGYVENIAERINRADVMLHAIKYLPCAGSRFGLLSSAYPCFVAHEAIQETVPELVNNEACLIAHNGETFVDALLEACENRETNKSLRVNARNVYEKYYTYERFFIFLNEALHATAGLDYDAELLTKYTYNLDANSSDPILSSLEIKKHE